MTLAAIVIHPEHNSPGKRDVTGAFRPEAERFAEHHGIPSHCVHSFDNRASAAKRREQVESLIWAHDWDLLDCVALFCHGTKRGLQTGHSTAAHMQSLAQVIAMRSQAHVRVALYACSTAAVGGEDEKKPGPGGDGGPADRLRDWLSTEGCSGGWVDAHATVGHTTRNPYARRFYTVGNTTGEKVDVPGGDWIVAPGSPEWRSWSRALWSKAEPRDMRFRFPLLTVAAARALL